MTQPANILGYSVSPLLFFFVLRFTYGSRLLSENIGTDWPIGATRRRTPYPPSFNVTKLLYNSHTELLITTAAIEGGSVPVTNNSWVIQFRFQAHRRQALSLDRTWRITLAHSPFQDLMGLLQLSLKGFVDLKLFSTRSPLAQPFDSWYLSPESLRRGGIY